MTCQVANVLKKDGVKKGDRVAIYMPVSPLLVASMLACARIGAIHRYQYLFAFVLLYICTGEFRYNYCVGIDSTVNLARFVVTTEFEIECCISINSYTVNWEISALYFYEGQRVVIFSNYCVTILLMYSFVFVCV